MRRLFVGSIVAIAETIESQYNLSNKRNYCGNKGLQPLVAVTLLFRLLTILLIFAIL